MSHTSFCPLIINKGVVCVVYIAALTWDCRPWFFQGGYPVAPTSLVPQWQDNWAAIAPVAQELLDNGTIIGFFLGDELVRSISNDRQQYNRELRCGTALTRPI